MSRETQTRIGPSTAPDTTDNQQPPIDDVVEFTPDKPEEPTTTTSSTTTTATTSTAREVVENPYITKQDAAEEQSYEAHLLGGRVEKGSLAAQMQSSADKLAYARRRQSEW
ncbi:hypothetical protein FQN50_009709 [Emmonsiellopsis sp. PD_5]|nr:hypothetical protein FQN50_009709 [Emmonsiellopsis sp. PD_5]